MMICYSQGIGIENGSNHREITESSFVLLLFSFLQATWQMLSEGISRDFFTKLIDTEVRGTYHIVVCEAS